MITITIDFASTIHYVTVQTPQQTDCGMMSIKNIIIFTCYAFITHFFTLLPSFKAKKNGVQGFFRGVGLGLMGAALKPVMGVTDGLTSVVRYFRDPKHIYSSLSFTE